MNYNCAAALQTRSLGVFGASPHRNLSPRISGHPALEFLTASPTLQPRKNQYVRSLSLKKNKPRKLKLVGTPAAALLSVVRWTYTNCYTPGSGSQTEGQVLPH